MKVLSIPTTLFGLYFGLSPVFWLPFLDHTLFLVFKTTLVFAAVITFIITSKYQSFPAGLHGYTGLLFIFFAYTVSVLVSINTSNFNGLVDMLYPIVMLYAGYNFAKYEDHLKKIFKIALMVIGAISIIYLYYVSFHGNILSPYDVSIKDAGFGGLRTGWSNGLALLIFLPFLLLRKSENGFNNIRLIVTVVFIVTIYTSMFLTGGRTGLLASLFTMLFFLVIYYRRNYLKLLLSLMILIVPIYYFANVYQDHLRIDRVTGNITEIENVDEITAGRVSLNKTAINHIIIKPFFGWGNSDGGFRDNARTSGHNLWLRLGGEYGMIFSLLLFVFVLRMVFKSVRNVFYLCDDINQSDMLSEIKKLKLLMSLIIITGFIITFSEPGMLIGSFQLSSVWWFIFGNLMSIDNDEH